ncbi:MAG: hypothetical protein AAB639_02720 [Patescibacteria group bacterium]
MKKSTIGVLGVGEVGKAISQILAKRFKVLKKDLVFDEIKNTKLNVLHVCISYSEKFTNHVVRQIKKNKPDLVIIHSTILPGATMEIFNKTSTPIVHSPIMGTHPNLAKDLLIFTKIIGPTDKYSARLAAKHLEKVGIKTVVFNSSLESEIGKLFDTTYYAWNIIFSKIVWNICQDKALDFNNVYTRLNEIYNLGYRKSKPNVIRPVLKYQPGPIGGRCLITNARMLEEAIPSMVTKIIIEENEKF